MYDEGKLELRSFEGRKRKLVGGGEKLSRWVHC